MEDCRLDNVVVLVIVSSCCKLHKMEKNIEIERPFANHAEHLVVSLLRSKFKQGAEGSSEGLRDLDEALAGAHNVVASFKSRVIEDKLRDILGDLWEQVYRRACNVDPEYWEKIKSLNGKDCDLIEKVRDTRSKMVFNTMFGSEEEVEQSEDFEDWERQLFYREPVLFVSSRAAELKDLDPSAFERLNELLDEVRIYKVEVKQIYDLCFGSNSDISVSARESLWDAFTFMLKTKPSGDQDILSIWEATTEYFNI